MQPTSIIEPTCGLGGFLNAALDCFPNAHGYGFEINSEYLRAARENLAEHSKRLTLEEKDFFNVDWSKRFEETKGPLLILGNPPWVTNSELTKLGSENRPERTNDKKKRGIEALTGASNFDISEWMIRRLIDQFKNRDFQLAMLCKRSVARKVLAHYWSKGTEFSTAKLISIDSDKFFGASVAACFFIVSSQNAKAKHKTALVCRDFTENKGTRIGYVEGRVVADVESYQKTQHLAGSSPLKWRSGLKHDLAKVMELRREKTKWFNGLNEEIELEGEARYPLLKSSDLMKETLGEVRRFVLVTQRKIGQETDSLQRQWPKLWAYLQKHERSFSARRSRIYQNKPRFSIFGIGDYSFAPWKVAISGFASRLQFHVIGPVDKKAVMLDDTCYFLPFSSKSDALFIGGLLNSKKSLAFYSSLIFWSNKRPVTQAILAALDLEKVAAERGAEDLMRFQGIVAASRKPQAPQTP